MDVKTNKLVKAGLFIAFGLIIPTIFHTVGMAGEIFLPMHLPVLLCGFLLGGRYGLIAGLITPLLSSVLTGMPPIFPVSISMALELASYGCISGWMYKGKKINVFVSLIVAMIAGRIVSGAANYILLSMAGKKYMLAAFLTSSFVTPVWGIIIQLIAIPVIINLVNKNTGAKF